MIYFWNDHICPYTEKDIEKMAGNAWAKQRTVKKTWIKAAADIDHGGRKSQFALKNLIYQIRSSFCAGAVYLPSANANDRIFSTRDGKMWQ